MGLLHLTLKPIISMCDIMDGTLFRLLVIITMPPPPGTHNLAFHTLIQVSDTADCSDLATRNPEQQNQNLHGLLSNDFGVGLLEKEAM